MAQSVRSKPVHLFWFRRDLRLKDNHGLFKALTAGLPVVPVFIFDSAILESLDERKDSRVEFILNSLLELNSELFVKHKSSIQIFFGLPKEVFKKITERFSVVSVFANEDYEPYAIERDEEIRSLLSAIGIGFKTFKDQVIFNPNECLKSDGSPYLVFTPYSKQWKKQLRNSDLEPFKSENHLDQLLPLSPTSVATLKDIGFQKADVAIPKRSLSKAALKNYKERRDFPAFRGGTSKIGVHLRFGTVSVRHCVKVARELSESWLNELIWREFFMTILFHFPRTVNQAFKSKYASVRWREDQMDFKRWREGKTGYPIVDAGIREMLQTGFMHNRVRMIVASFLCKHLLLPWTWGERFFARHLLDFELSSNVGNWQWVAGSGVDAAPYFRIFNPESQTQKFDPEHRYIKKWVPEYQTDKYVEPMVDHEFARRRALKVYNEALRS